MSSEHISLNLLHHLYQYANYNMEHARVVRCGRCRLNCILWHELNWFQAILVYTCPALRCLFIIMLSHAVQCCPKWFNLCVSSARACISTDAEKACSHARVRTRSVAKLVFFLSFFSKLTHISARVPAHVPVIKSRAWMHRCFCPSSKNIIGYWHLHINMRNVIVVRAHSL